MSCARQLCNLITCFDSCSRIVSSDSFSFEAVFFIYKKSSRHLV
nr:MAG TPA: hypothetical protein [Caudoviricetes sp.]